MLCVSGDYGGGEKCSTHYETVYATVYDTVYQKKCSKGSNKKCKIIHSTSYKGGVETQCHPSYEPKCKTIYKTGYKKFCTTIKDKECYFIHKSTYKTVYDKDCKTEYKKSCHDVGHGYHKETKCSSKPVHKCIDVPKKIHSSHPVKKCNEVPKEKCHSVPKSVPEKKCFHVPKQHCENVPVKNPISIPKKQCWDVETKHCHSVPVKKPRTIAKKVPKIACVSKGHGYGHDHEDHYSGGYGHEDHGDGYGHDHQKGGHSVGGYKEHHRRSDANQNNSGDSLSYKNSVYYNKYPTGVEAGHTNKLTEDAPMKSFDNFHDVQYHHDNNYSAQYDRKTYDVPMKSYDNYHDDNYNYDDKYPSQYDPTHNSDDLHSHFHSLDKENPNYTVPTEHVSHDPYSAYGESSNDVKEDFGNLNLFDGPDMEREAKNLALRFASNSFSNDYYQNFYEEANIY